MGDSTCPVGNTFHRWSDALCHFESEVTHEQFNEVFFCCCGGHRAGFGLGYFGNDRRGVTILERYEENPVGGYVFSSLRDLFTGLENLDYRVCVNMPSLPLEHFIFNNTIVLYQMLAGETSTNRASAVRPGREQREMKCARTQ
jgi:hypothetical protein